MWNAPPFLLVEGYASFLWVAVLDIFWRVTGVELPDIAVPFLWHPRDLCCNLHLFFIARAMDALGRYKELQHKEVNSRYEGFRCSSLVLVSSVVCGSIRQDAGVADTALCLYAAPRA